MADSVKTQVRTKLKAGINKATANSFIIYCLKREEIRGERIVKMKEGPLKLIFKYMKTLSAAFAITLFVLVCSYAAYEKRDVDTDRAFLAKEHEIFISGQKRLIDTELSEIVSDLLYLEENAFFKNYIYGNGTKEDVENEWLLFAGKMKQYDQLRYLDKQGNEIIRINFNEGKPVIVGKDALQNKGDRQYFIETIKLDNRNIYRSAFDLNVEGSQIDLPTKPMIRFGLPVFDQDNSKCGVIVVNYLGRNIIENVKRSMRDNNFMQLVNEEGYWLAGTNSESEWAFMYPDKRGETFDNRFPEEWSRILAEKNGQFFTSKGLFTFRIVNPDIEARSRLIGTNDESVKINGADKAWFLISHVPPSVIPYASNENGYLIGLKRLYEIPSLLIGIMFIACVFTILFTLYRAENAKLMEIATHDIMTGCLNRRAGTQIIEEGIKRAERYKEPLSMFLLDIDHFKNVNDTWGHIAGDRVLKEVAKIIRKEIRESDNVIRSGGEEFVVFMPRTDLKGALLAAEKLRLALENQPHPNVGKVTASFGVAEKRKEETQLQWYKRVDDALYRAKEAGRNRVASAEDLKEILPIATVQLEWNSEWESGNEELDRQHREMVKLGNELIFTAFSDSMAEEIEAKLDEFLNHAIYHFNYEERVLAGIGFTGSEEHSAIHKTIITEALRLKDAYLKGILKPSSFFSFVVDDVIVGHMLKEDAKFFPYLNKKF